MRWIDLATGVAALAGAAMAQTALPFPTSCSGVPASRYQYNLDSAWQIAKIGTGLKQPRTIIFDTLGQMLILQATTGISVSTLGPNGCIASTTMLVSNKALNHGLALTPDGKTIYASGETAAYSWDYDAATKKIGTQKTVVRAISTGIHSTRTLAIVPSRPELLIISVGSNSNWDYPTGSPSAGRACVKVFDTSKTPDGGYQYNTGGYQLGYGMRNEIGLAFDPNGHVWGVENSGDDFRRTVNGQGVDIHIDNPAEELNYLGDPTKPNNNWYGYPTCFTVGDPSVIKDKTLAVGDQFVVTPNNTFDDAACRQKSIPPRLSFAAHSAPISNIFDKDATNMYVTFHGSWNRQPATGYKVVEIPFKKLDNGNYDPVAKITDPKGYKDIFWASNPGSCQSQSLTQSSCFRLAALAWDPTGTRLYVSSDNNAEGEIWVLAKK